MTSLAGATQDEVRRANLSLVLTLLHREGAQSRSHIVAASGLNRSTVGGLVAELVDLGLVREQAGVGRGVGRPSLVVEPVAESAVVLALDVRVERTVAAVIGLGGKVFVRQEHRHHDALANPDLIVDEVARIAQTVMAHAPAGSAWIGTAVGVPGIVSTDDGLVRLAPNLGWVDVPLGRLLMKALGQRSGTVQIRNDADLGGLAEHLRGAGQGADSMIYLAGDVGIGGGVIVDGRPLMGAGGYGGEVGHMRVNPQGSICRCGARGCWETEIGAQALLDGVDGSPANVVDVVAAAQAGDEQAQARLTDAAYWLGVGLVNLTHLFNPQAVVLGGHLAAVQAASPTSVSSELGQALPAALEQLRVVPSALGPDATLIGAAEVAMDALLGDPVGILSGRRAAS